jgi:hypothetical protein
LVFAAVARHAPIVEVIIGGCVFVVVRQGRCSRKDALLTRVQIVGASPAGHFAGPAPDSDRSRIAVGVDTDAIFAGAEKREGQVGRVNFVRVVVTQLPQANIQRPLSELNLDCLVV